MILALPVPYFEARGFGQTSAQIQAQITAEANSLGVPPSIALGVAQHESGFIPTAQNPSSSAAGLFQLTSSAQQYEGVTNPYDATQNIDAGVSLLAMYYQKYGNWPDALQAFSDGPGTVGVSPPSSQTQGLISYISSNYGVDLSAPSSSGIDLSSLGLPDVSLSSLSLPDLSQSTIIDGVPDWVTWLGIGLAGFAAVKLIA
jgi:soluble lytic murein transglycosylase-like protein